MATSGDFRDGTHVVFVLQHPDDADMGICSRDRNIPICLVLDICYNSVGIDASYGLIAKKDASK